MTPAEILALIKENDVKFVDLRFSDTKGKEQHVTVPAHVLNEDLFEEGKMFDGSSISGWKGINESDMILLPDAASAVLDIFFGRHHVKPALQCRRTDDNAGLRSLSTIAGHSCRGLSEINGNCRRCLFRAGKRVLRL